MTQLEAPLRGADLRLAGLHLRMGAHQLARAELEALAGANALDPAALLDLADARWRTGDLPGAGVAAQAYLGEGGEAVLAFVIAAESSHASGRATEARRLAAEALGRADVPLDRLFAGMPRSGVWPIGAAERPEPVAELFPAAPWAAGLAVPSPSVGGPDVVPVVVKVNVLHILAEKIGHARRALSRGLRRGLSLLRGSGGRRRGRRGRRRRGRGRAADLVVARRCAVQTGAGGGTGIVTSGTRYWRRHRYATPLRTGHCQRPVHATVDQHFPDAGALQAGCASGRPAGGVI